MPNDDRPLIEDYTNEDWLNAVRNDAGLDYQHRIPEATQANIQDVIQTLWTYKPLMNQFVDVLVNRIGLVLFQEWSWSNPLAPLKRGMLNWGETIEEIMVGLVEADEYDADRDELEKEIFGAKKPEVQASYHVVNRRNRYKITIKEALLRNAFISANGLSSFVTQLMDSLTKSDQVDEYYAMANLFKEIDLAATGPDGTSGIFNLNIADIGDEDSTTEQNKYALRRMREIGTTLQFPSRAYNPAGMPMAVRPSDLILFTTPAADAAMDVEALAGAFNIDKAQVGYRKFVLPAEHYGIPGFQMAVTTKEFFVVADQRIDTTSQVNPAALFTNYWLHHWQVISASRFAPIVMFNSLRPSTQLSPTVYEVTGITAFTITDQDGATAATNLLRGQFYDVAVEAETTPAGGPNKAVRLDVIGNTSVFTRITNNGALFIGPDENTQTLTIRATVVDSDDVEQLYEETTRGIAGDGVVPWPHGHLISDPDQDAVENATIIPLTKDPDTDIVKIPHATGVQYRKAGVNVTNGSEHLITASTVFDAIARAGYELNAGTATWTFVP